jgi:hypothetical protein
MRKLSPLALLVALCLISATLQGCWIQPDPQTPAQLLAMVEGDYTAALDAATELKKAGKFNDAQVIGLKRAMDSIDKVLDAAHLALGLSETAKFTGLIDSAKEMILDLKEYLK